MNQPSDTPTPQTDAAIGNWSYEHHEVVTSYFARTLERELNEAKRQLELQTGYLRAQLNLRKDVDKDREAAEQKVMELRKALEDIAAHTRPPFVNTQWLNYANDVASKALSSSAPIAAKWVPVDDVRPLIPNISQFTEQTCACEYCNAGRAFLAIHGDKFKTQSQ